MGGGIYLHKGSTLIWGEVPNEGRLARSLPEIVRFFALLWRHRGETTDDYDNYKQKHDK